MYGYTAPNSQHAAERNRMLALSQSFDQTLVAAYFDRASEANFLVRESLAGDRVAIRILNYEFDRDCGQLADTASKVRRRDYVSRRLAFGPFVEVPAFDGPVISFVVLARAGFDISPETLDVCLGAMTAEIADLKRQVAELTKKG